MLLVVVLIVVVYSALFQYLMSVEGREYSWSTSVYWTLVTMSTLGYGDIVFDSEMGHVFTSVVLVSGVTVILVLLPFLIIQFIVRPFLDRLEAARVPRRVREGMEDHIVMTGLDVVTDALCQLAKHEGARYVLLVPELTEALRLQNSGYEVMLGDLDDPETYRRARVDKASMVVTTRPDTTNTNVAFTVREISPHVAVVATANAGASVPILELAGCTEVVQLGKNLGQALAQRVVGVDTRSHVIGEFGDLCIAEANVRGTPLAGQTLAETGVYDHPDLNILGVREKGAFSVASPDARLTSRSILVLAGSVQQLSKYDAILAEDTTLDRPVLVIGGGRVGRAAAESLEEVGIHPVIVEKRPERVQPGRTYVVGDAADINVLERAGLRDAAAVLVTTHEDDVNVYLTLYLRKLEPDLQVIARATRERNVTTLHRAGADAVLSYASIGASTIWNILGWRPRLVVAEGIDVFRAPVPRALRGRTLNDANVGARTGCEVVALVREGRFQIPDQNELLPSNAELLLIGEEAAEQRFVDRYAG
ncbi:potassium channel family protein [Citricoccus alkalitolerans]|uniref:Potassium channel family protein n=1 Tax=Citricoccus alkalitolerans TaxID=246603 RepID=A0ABV8XWZ2_9MICC